MIKDGIIAIDKPEGISSAAVVARIKKILGVKKAGHTGTLDPFATGLMLCGINKGTKLSQFFLDSDKRYIAKIALGTETDTQDYTGNITKQCDPDKLNTITHQSVMNTIDKFNGVQMQHPPVYSALKHNGTPLYKLARLGQPVQKPPRRIEIYSIEVERIEKISESETPQNLCVTISVHCSSGTYIRTLAHDIGQKLGCGACLSYLRRTQTCGFTIDNATTLDKLEKMPQAKVFDGIIPMTQALFFMPLIQADDTLIERIRFGRPFLLSEKCILPDSLQSSDSSLNSGYISPSCGFDSSKSCKQLSSSNNSVYMRVINSQGDLAAIVEYDKTRDKYDYCCVFAN